jgi:DNA polymerase III subunit epsilon
MHDASGPQRFAVVRRFEPTLLPSELLVDATDAARVGIRIALKDTAAARQTALTAAIDCAGLLDVDTAVRSMEYTVVDVETTGGAYSRGHRVTEIAAIRVRGDGTVVDEYRSLVNPERPIPSFISALTSITWEMVRDAPRFSDIAPDVARVLRGAVFVAHNAAFDWQFVCAELGRAGVPITGRTLCTVRLARKVVPELRSRSLDSLSCFFNIDNRARHRAYGDAVATVELLRRLLDRLDGLEVNRWAELEELLAQRAKRRRRQANPQPVQDA